LIIKKSGIEFSAAFFVSTIVMGAIYGLLIEVITSALFKAKAVAK